MYRAALEQLLFEQGFKVRILQPKINELLAERDGGTPREWIRSLNPRYLDAIKRLGNASIHPNDGNIQRQRVFDRKLLAVVRALFVSLLDSVYEKPHRENAQLETLDDALRDLP